MSDDHLPDLRHARNWLDEIRADLLAARERARLALDGDYDVTEELIEFARLAEAHAATLGDIIARGEIVATTDDLPSNAQLVAMRRRMRKDVSATVFIEPFDLPPGYVLVRYSDGFECGISREGDVSS